MTDAELIQDSFAALAPVMHEVVDRFYDRLFAAQPRLRALFPPDMKVQKDHFIAALGTAVGHAHDLAAIETPLREMGARHIRYGATPDLYRVVSAELVGAVGDIARRESPDDSTPDHPRAWARTVDAIAAAMLRGTSGSGTASA
jgi:hemoglobin-like flavoprotein